MPFFTEQLIEIYAKCKVDVIGHNDEFIRLRDENQDHPTFRSVNRTVQDIKRRLEKLVGIQTSKKNQVIEALMLLNRIIGGDEEKAEICYNLILRTYARAWDHSELDHFKKYYYALNNFYDYFLSFTNRNPSPGNDNIINRKYKHFITDVLGKTRYKEADKRKENLLAETINYLLKNADQPLKGFFYPQKEGDSRNVKNKLSQACRESFVFIQIVQNIMFVKINDTNYCHFEYQDAKKTDPPSKSIRFLLARGDS